MDIDKLIPLRSYNGATIGFGSLMDIDKLIRYGAVFLVDTRFGSLMDIDKLILEVRLNGTRYVLVL